MGHRRSELKMRGKDLAQPRAQLGMGQPESDSRFEKAKTVAAMVAAAGNSQPVEVLAVSDQLLERVGRFDLHHYRPRRERGVRTPGAG